MHINLMKTQNLPRTKDCTKNSLSRRQKNIIKTLHESALAV